MIRSQENDCEAEFDKWIPSAGTKAPQIPDALGTALSYLDLIASSWWGRREGDNLEERLLGKAVSHARAALRLLKIGYYDEALTIIRQMGEIANLLLLLMTSNESLLEYQNANDDERRRQFSPVKIRERLRNLGSSVPMDQDTYSLFSSQYVHVNPSSGPQNHNRFGISTLGGYFQEGGALATLNHLAALVAFMLWFGSTLPEHTRDQEVALKASRELNRLVGGIDIKSLQQYFKKVRETAHVQED